MSCILPVCFRCICLFCTYSLKGTAYTAYVLLKLIWLPPQVVWLTGPSHCVCVCVCTWHNIYAGIIPTQYQHSKHMLTPAVKRDALIHECVLNEQSVEYWDAFQNSRVDHDKIIFLWQSCFKWNKLPLCVNKEVQCNCGTILIEHINYPCLKCPKHNTFMFREYWGKWWICCKVSCRLILKNHSFLTFERFY